MFLLLERFFIESIQLLPKIFVKLLQREVLTLFKLVEKTFLKDTYCIFHRTFELRFTDFRRENNRTIMVCPVSVILVQFRFNPVLIDDDACLQLSQTTKAGTPPK